jgi:hypothetical protein
MNSNGVPVRSIIRNNNISLNRPVSKTVHFSEHLEKKFIVPSFKKYNIPEEERVLGCNCIIL